MSTIATTTGSHVISTTSTSDPLPDPIVKLYASYVDEGKIRFRTPLLTRWGSINTRRTFTYHIASKELWRTYTRSLKDYRRLHTYRGPVQYIQDQKLIPLIPKYMQVDKGL